MLSGLISRTKVKPMSHDVFKKQIYSSISEILNDPKLYYVSAIDKKYNKFTEEGTQAVIEFFTMMAPHILEREKIEFDKRAKDMVLNTLKDSD